MARQSQRTRAMSRFHPAAFALTSDGTLLVNLAVAGDAAHVTELLAAAGDAPVFVGVPVPPAAERQVRARLDDASHEAAAKIAGALRRPKRRAR